MHQGSWSNYHFLDELSLGLEPNEQRELMSSEITLGQRVLEMF